MEKKRPVLDVGRFFSIKPVIHGQFSSKFAPKPNSKFSKRGQVTIFIILGILLLLALTLIIFMKKEIVSLKPEELFPTQKGKVENYLTTCMDKLGEEDLLKIGTKGGYIEVPKELTDASVSLKLSPMNVIPYWAYGQNTNIPQLEEIKQRIDTYLEQNMRSCLFGMKAFQETYDLVEKSSLTSDTQIVESKVIFNLHWNIEVRNKAGEVISEVIDHTSESSVKLKKVYELSKHLLEMELETLKLEDLTQDLIALEHPNLPAAGIEISCSKKTWDPEKAKQTLLDMLRINIRELKVKGTDYVNFPEELTYYQNHYVWDLGAGYVEPELSVVFNFDQTYPYTFAVTPLSGKKMKSSQLGGSDLLSFLCIQTWKFSYDMIYPITVRVRDETTGYDFNLAFTVHLVRNTPNRGESYARPSYFLSTFTDEEYCKNKNVPMTVKTYEYVENGQGVSYSEDLGKVNLSFTCLRYQCDLGASDSDYANLGYAGIITNFPYCVGGILRGEKPGYKEDWVRVVTVPAKEVNLQLVPLIKVPLKKVKIMKYDLTAGLTADNKIKALGKELSKEETALIKLTFFDTNQTEKKIVHETSIVKSKQLGSQLESEEQLELLAKADYNYLLEINLLDGEEIVGGYKGAWNLPWNKLNGAQEIILPVINIPNPSEEQMIELILGVEEQSKLLPAPEIK